MEFNNFIVIIPPKDIYISSNIIFTRNNAAALHNNQYVLQVHKKGQHLSSALRDLTKGANVSDTLEWVTNHLYLK